MAVIGYYLLVRKIVISYFACKIRKDKKTLFEFGFCITINTSSQELFTEEGAFYHD
jgi:hypothetical protein